MKLSQFITAIALSISFFVHVSCSTSGLTTRGKGGTASAYPDWYNPNQSFEADTATAFIGYATALAGDSVKAAQKAFVQAAEELKSGISRRLEAVRKKAADELGNSSGLNTAGFIVTLRNAETHITDASEQTNVETSANESNYGYRGFAEATISQEALMRQLNEAMRRYRTAWSAMKTSQAFSEF